LYYEYQGKYENLINISTAQIKEELTENVKYGGKGMQEGKKKEY
jgi:hypothetical protein